MLTDDFDNKHCSLKLTIGAESVKGVALGAELAHSLWRDLIANSHDEAFADE